MREMYGVHELAEVLGVSPDVVSQWRRRGKVPEPAVTLACGPVWHGAVIERWLRVRKAAG